jgi:hypothetical protein
MASLGGKLHIAQVVKLRGSPEILTMAFETGKDSVEHAGMPSSTGKQKIVSFLRIVAIESQPAVKLYRTAKL